MTNNTSASNQISKRLTADLLNSMICDMTNSNHPDDSTILGHIMQGNRCIQVQLVITQDQKQFMEWVG